MMMSFTKEKYMIEQYAIESNNQYCTVVNDAECQNINTLVRAMLNENKKNYHGKYRINNGNQLRILFHTISCNLTFIIIISGCFITYALPTYYIGQVIPNIPLYRTSDS